MATRSKRAERRDTLRARRYGRVSTADQDSPGTVSIPDQDRITAEYVQHRGMDDLGFTYDTETGTNTDRDAWRSLMADARAGRFDVVVVARMDRFSRRVLPGLQAMDELERLGVTVVLCDIQMDASTPAGRMFRTQMLAFAEMERDTIVSRLASGQYGKARNGGWPSSAAGAPFGLRKQGTGRDARLVEDQAEAHVIRTAAKLLVDERRPIGEVCKILNGLGLLPRNSKRGWYPDLLRECLSEPARFGRVVWGKQERSASGAYGEPVVIQGVPAVLSPERFELVQAALRRSGRAAGITPSRVYPLSLRMVSPCGQPYYGVMRNDLNLAQYRCRGTKWHPWPDWQSCGCTRLRADDLEARVWSRVTALLGDPASLRALAAEYFGTPDAPSRQDELTELSASIATLQARVSAGIVSYVRAGLDPEAVADAMNQLEDELSALRRRRDDLQRWAEDDKLRDASLSQLDRLAATAAARLDRMDLPHQAEILDLLEVQVVVLDASKNPDLRITGVICSSEIADPASARNPADQGSRSRPPGVTLPFVLAA